VPFADVAFKMATDFDKPETVAGNKSAVQLRDKNDIAAMCKISSRSVSNYMEKGMPHLRLGSRRVRFIESDVLAWLKTNCGCQRIGKLNGNAAKR
jgi:predicted DNA-binding transcriptional regulator AlpA